jgi:hypothetical protein
MRPLKKTLEHNLMVYMQFFHNHSSLVLRLNQSTFYNAGIALVSKDKNPSVETGNYAHNCFNMSAQPIKWKVIYSKGNVEIYMQLIVTYCTPFLWGIAIDMKFHVDVGSGHIDI